jgi:FixJ family two-component response regulator
MDDLIPFRPFRSEPPDAPRAMIVDDDTAMLRLVKNWMVGMGFAVDAFDQFAPAKRHLTRSTPNVLITDVRLGAFNGLQLVVFAKLAHPEIVAIVLTGFEDPVLRRDAAEAGAVYLAKPVRAQQLIEVIHAHTSAAS